MYRGLNISFVFLSIYDYAPVVMHLVDVFFNETPYWIKKKKELCEKDKFAKAKNLDPDVNNVIKSKECKKALRFVEALSAKQK